MFWFAIASLTPAALLALGCLFGDIWSGLGILAITVLAFGADRWVLRPTEQSADRSGRTVSYAQGIAHFILWGLGIWAIGAGAHLETLEKVLLVIGLGLYFGQISNSNAHELIHAADRLPRHVGTAIYGSLLFAHHVSAHTKVHHVHAATRNDPNTARLGEGFWRYLARAWVQGFVAGKRAEDRIRANRFRVWSHPYLGYLALSGAALVAAFALAGPKGLVALFVVTAYAQTQLYLSDYVQHYGLERSVTAQGKPEPMGPQHSWNAPHWYSSAMMLNAPRHSDHHLNPAKPFPALQLEPAQMPMLPQSLPVMAVIALVPPLWRRLMDHRARRWHPSHPVSPSGSSDADTPASLVTEQPV